jgi:hypothetical protein
MRVRIQLDSATPHEVYNATCALQRSAGLSRPVSLTTEPTVTVAGTAMSWTSPWLTLVGVDAWHHEMAALVADDEQRALERTGQDGFR